MHSNSKCFNSYTKSFADSNFLSGKGGQYSESSSDCPCETCSCLFMLISDLFLGRVYISPVGALSR